MKIAHVIYIPRLSGAEMIVRDLAISHAASGHKVGIISLEPYEKSFVNEINKLSAAEISIYFPQDRLSKLGRLNFVCKNIKDFNPDIVVAHSVIPSAYTRLGFKLRMFPSVPVVSVLHDASQDDYKSRYFRLLEKYWLPSPPQIIALTHLAADNYQRRISKDVNIKIIPNGIDVRTIKDAYDDRSRVRKDVFDVEDTEVVCLQIGRFGHAKQQHLSVRAFIQACQNCNFLGKLFLAGLVEDVDYEQNLRKIVADAKLQDKIIFLGPRSDIPELLAGADIYLMPSKQEAHSIAFMEALASGLSIIASDISAFRYGVEFPGVRLISPENTNLFAQEIANSGSYNAKKQWHRNLDSYSIENTSNSYMNIFKSLSKTR